MKYFYGVFCVLGIILPFSQFISWLNENGLNLPLMFYQITSDKLSLFAWFDVIISAVVLIGFVIWDSRKNNIKNAWISIISTCCVGVSLGLPLYLLIKEIQQEVKPS